MRNTTIKNIRIRSQNVNKNFQLMSDILEERKGSVDHLHIQEPPWRIIRRTVSATDPDGELVMGPPIHPDWMVIYRRPTGGLDQPRVMMYVNKRFAAMRPAFRRDIADHRDILCVTLQGAGETPLLLINVYSDSDSTAITWLTTNLANFGVHGIDGALVMSGDFNFNFFLFVVKNLYPGCATAGRRGRYNTN